LPPALLSGSPSAMALTHPKFSRSQDSPAEPEFPLMEPYPDRSWEDPEMRPPDGLVTSVHSVTVEGKEIEYHAGQQANLNNNLLSNVMDGAEAMELKHENNLELIKQIQRDMQDKHIDTAIHIKDYVCGLKFVSTDLGEAGFHEVCGLTMPVAELKALAGRTIEKRAEMEAVLSGDLAARKPTKIKEAEYYTLLREGLQPLFDSALVSFCYEKPAPISPTGVPLPESTIVGSGLADAGRSGVLLTSGLSVGAPAELSSFDVAKAILRGSYFLHTDHLSYVKDELADPAGNNKITKLRQAARQSIQERDAAEASGDYASVDRWSNLAVRNLEALIEAQNERVHLASASDGDVHSFVGDLESWQTETNAAMASVIETERRRVALIKADLEQLKAEGDRREQINTKSLGAFKAQMIESNKLLDQNSKAQDQAWREAIDILSKLPGLNQERMELVERMVQDTDTEKKRIADYDNWWSLARTREHISDLAMQGAEDGLRLARLVQDRFMSNIKQTMKDRAIEDQLASVQLKEATQMLSFFRDFTLTAGDLSDKKVRYLESLSGQLRHCDLQLATADETLDPDIEQHVHVRETILQKIAKAQDDVAHLSSRLLRWSDDFKHCEGLLTDLGVEFESPSVELMHLIAEREKRMVGKRREFVQKEQQALEQGQMKAKKVSSDAKHAQAAFSERVEVRRRASHIPSWRANESEIAAVLPEQLVTPDRPRRVSAIPRPATTAADLPGGSQRKVGQTRPATG